MLLAGENGQRIEIRGKNLKVSVSQRFERDDLSGDGSDTDVAPGGVKPKEVSVTLQIPVDRAEDLETLQKTAEALDSDGDPVMYVVSDRQCNVRGIRKVIFVGNLNSSESQGVRAWDVSFMLREMESVSEAKEERQVANILPPTAEGKPVVKVTDAASAAASYSFIPFTPPKLQS